MNFFIKSFYLLLLVLLISCSKKEFCFQGEYVFDLDTYLDQEHIRAVLRQIGLSNNNIEEMKEIDHWDNKAFFKNAMKDDLRREIIELLWLRYLEKSFVEITIKEEIIILKQYKMDDDLILIDLMKYEIFSQADNIITICLYDLDGAMIGLRNIILSEKDKIIVQNGEDKLFFRIKKE